MSPTPSRRRFLALCAAGSSAALAGCQSDSPGVETTSEVPAETDEPPSGLVWQKEISVVLSRADPSVRTDLLRLKYDRESGNVRGSFDPEYADGVIDGASVTVSESVHDSLTTEFGDVAYRIYVGPVDDDKHLHVRTRRAAFNDFPLAGTATVERSWVRESEDVRVKYARPTDTSVPNESPEEIDVRPFDLGERHQSY